MDAANKVTLKYFSLFLCVFAFTFFCVKSSGRKDNYSAYYNLLTHDTDKPSKSKSILPLTISDTIPSKKRNDSSAVAENVDTFHLKYSGDSLEGPISYDADDSMVYDVPGQKIMLYGKKAKTIYQDNELDAPLIEFNQATGNLMASLKRDTAGNVIAFPTFKQSDFSSQSDSIIFNLKSKKGLTKSTYTQQGEMYVYGKVMKKVSNDVFYVKGGRFTTCNLDTPHFAFISNRIKFINKKVAISGPVHPEFEGVPIPIYLPFGIYPLNQNRHSGFLAPNFTSNEQLGLGLENGGYYKIFGPYWDLIVKGNLYSYGGWTLDLDPRYSRRYRYAGNIGLHILNTSFNFKGDPDYVKNKAFNFTWNHSLDAKARPGVTFSANVNAGSSSYNSYVPNNPTTNFNNQLTSHITYSKTWKDKPFNLTISASHNQNTNLKLINVTLPEVSFTATTIYPFRRKELIGPTKWYENLGIGYNGNAKSLFSFFDTLPNILKHIKDTLQWGAHHSVPISISLPKLGIFQLGPAISYDETWYQRKFIRSWDSTQNKVDTSYKYGFFTARQVSFGINLTTRIFGMITPKNKNSRIVAIRHEIRPTIGLSYRPDLNTRNYYYTKVDSASQQQLFSVYEGNIFAPYGPGRFGGINFGIDNNVQMKVKDRKDTTKQSEKKVSLLDGFSISGSYNLVADSFKFSPFILSARSTLFNKLNITAGGTIDPYEVGTNGQRINKLIWARKASLGRFTGGNVSMSSSFHGGDQSKTMHQRTDLLSNNYAQNNGYANDELNSELAYINNNPGQFADFSIPWSINFSYALIFSRVFRSDYSGFTTNTTQTTNFTGTLNLSPKWQIAFNGSYNLSDAQLGLLSFSLSRDMHCWQMGIEVSPVGRYRFFSINISPKSPILRDLRINRTRSFYD